MDGQKEKRSRGKSPKNGIAAVTVNFEPERDVVKKPARAKFLFWAKRQKQEPY